MMTLKLKPYYQENVKFFKPLAHILYFATSEEDTHSVDPYSDKNNTIQSIKLFNLIYKTIDLNNFFLSVFYILVPSYIDVGDESLIDQFYDQALKDYDQFDLFKQFQYRHKYNKQTIRNLLKQKDFNSIILQFCADYLDVNMIIFENNKMKTIYSKKPTPYKAHILLMANQENQYQPLFQDKKYIFTSNDQISWIAFRKHVMDSKIKSGN
jgi:hypothetical protein